MGFGVEWRVEVGWSLAGMYEVYVRFSDRGMTFKFYRRTCPFMFFKKDNSKVRYRPRKAHSMAPLGNGACYPIRLTNSKRLGHHTPRTRHSDTP